jgi:hypothetical protein
VEAPVDQLQVVDDRGGAPDLVSGIEPALKVLDELQVDGLFERVGVVRLHDHVDRVGPLQVLVHRLEVHANRRVGSELAGVRGSDADQRSAVDRDQRDQGGGDEDGRPVPHVEARHALCEAVEGVAGLARFGLPPRSRPDQHQQRRRQRERRQHRHHDADEREQTELGDGTERAQHEREEADGRRQAREGDRQRDVAQRADRPLAPLAVGLLAAGGVELGDDVHRVGQAEREQERGHDAGDRVERVAESSDTAECPDQRDQDRDQRHHDAVQAAEREGEHHGEYEQYERRREDQVPQQNAGGDRLDARQTGDPDPGLAPFLVRDLLDLLVEPPLDELAIREVQEVDQQRGRRALAIDQVARVDRVAEHLAPDAGGFDRLARRHEGRDLEVVGGAADVQRVGQRDDLPYALELLEATGEPDHGLQVLRREDVVVHQRDDHRLVAAEDAAHPVVELLGRIVLRQQPVGRRIDLEPALSRAQVDQLVRGYDDQQRR